MLNCLAAPFMANFRDADYLGIERLLRHELAYELRIFDLPVVGQQVRFAQNRFRAIVQFRGFMLPALRQ